MRPQQTQVVQPDISETVETPKIHLRSNVGNFHTTIHQQVPADAPPPFPLRPN